MVTSNTVSLQPSYNQQVSPMVVDCPDGRVLFLWPAYSASTGAYYNFARWDESAQTVTTVGANKILTPVPWSNKVTWARFTDDVIAIAGSDTNGSDEFGFITLVRINPDDTLTVLNNYSFPSTRFNTKSNGYVHIKQTVIGGDLVNGSGAVLAVVPGGVKSTGNTSPIGSRWFDEGFDFGTAAQVCRSVTYDGGSGLTFGPPQPLLDQTSWTRQETLFNESNLDIRLYVAPRTIERIVVGSSYGIVYRRRAESILMTATIHPTTKAYVRDFLSSTGSAVLAFYPGTEPSWYGTPPAGQSVLSTDTSIEVVSLTGQGLAVPPAKYSTKQFWTPDVPGFDAALPKPSIPAGFIHSLDFSFDSSQENGRIGYGTGYSEDFANGTVMDGGFGRDIRCAPVPAGPNSWYITVRNDNRDDYTQDAIGNVPPAASAYWTRVLKLTASASGLTAELILELPDWLKPDYTSNFRFYTHDVPSIGMSRGRLKYGLACYHFNRRSGSQTQEYLYAITEISGPDEHDEGWKTVTELPPFTHPTAYNPQNGDNGYVYKQTAAVLAPSDEQGYFRAYMQDTGNAFVMAYQDAEAPLPAPVSALKETRRAFV